LHRRMLLKMPLLRSLRSILKTATVCMKPYRRQGSHSRFGRVPSAVSRRSGDLGRRRGVA
jgi:hypothetical protein